MGHNELTDESHSNFEAFKKTTHTLTKSQYDEMYKQSIEKPWEFWADVASELYFETPPTKSEDSVNWNFNLDRGKIYQEWFKGSTTNMCYNCVDRHVEKGRGNEPCFKWEGSEEGEDRVLTFREVQNEVSKLSNWLKEKHVKKGDTVAIYMALECELPIAMLACARIGAVHSVVFAGFSADSLAQRLLDCEASVLLTQSAAMRGKKRVDLKPIADSALEKAKEDGHTVSNVLVLDNPRAISREDVAIDARRDEMWQDSIRHQPVDCEVEWMDAEDPLFMLYTSGSTGKPKGVLHTTGGYMLQAYLTTKYVLSLNTNDVYWCTADPGWITGHTYLCYGPMLTGTTQVLFEGVPTYPDPGRIWRAVDKHRVSVFYTAPTAVRALMQSGDTFVESSKRESLRLLGTVGEPINPEAWRWLFHVIGGSSCPIVDTYWQTETGGHMIAPIPGVDGWHLKPGSATLPFFGVKPALLDPQSGEEIEGEGEGVLVFKKPWPGGMRSIYKNHERFEENYFSMYRGYYFTGDAAKRDLDGFYWITGRVDDVINVSGHRIGTAEVEGALVGHPKCVEAAVVGVEHKLKGQGIYAYVSLVEGSELDEELKAELKKEVRGSIGAFAAPDSVHEASALPKTRSGKIMRRVLRKIAANEDDQIGDTSTLADPSVVDRLIASRPPQ